MFESCVEIRNHFSDCLDALCGPETLRSIRYHLDYCASCRDELNRSQALQADLRKLTRRRVPPELALRLRVLLSRELHRDLLGRLWVHVENALQPLFFPASAGVLTSIIFFGLFLGAYVVPETNIPDVPIQLLTPPRVRTLAPIDFSTDDRAVVLFTRIGADGRVVHYKVLSGQDSPELMRRLDRIMLFSRFHPATMFGRPTDGQMVLSLRRITVRG